MDQLETPQPSHHVAGHDPGVILGVMVEGRQDREVPAPEVEPAEGQVIVTAWGRWPW